MRPVLLASLLLASTAHADEGMWLPEQIPEIAPEWTDRGLAISPDKLADPLGEPLGAIVSLGFCSASFVSPDGLILTNHHCVERFLQQNSTGERNLHRDGYVAATRMDELSVGPGGRVQVVEAITDVTDQVLAKVGRRTRDAKRERLVREASNRLVAACERQADRRCRVARYRGGAEFRLIRSLELKDVRIVAAPPMSVGQFGGEVDNWMWPRHGADFAVLRAYVSPDGSVAEYADDNVPYQPTHHLELDPTGAEAGSFVMVAGFPGRTSRHARAETLRWYAQDYLPTRQRLTSEVRDILQGHADADPDAAARVGASISGLANSLKNSQGLVEGLSQGDLIARKLSEEAALLTWLEQDGNPRLLDPIAEHLEVMKDDHADSLQDVYVNWMVRGADLLSVGFTAVRWAEEREKRDDLSRDPGFQDRDRERIEARFQRLEASYHPPSDKDVFAHLLAAYLATDSDRHVQAIDAWIEAQGGADAAVERLYGDSELVSTEGRLAVLDQDLDALKASDDPWIELALIVSDWRRPRRDQDRERRGARLRLEPSWYAALDAHSASRDQVLYDDANGTLRLTLGEVVGYEPQDGLIAVPQTTASGFAAKAGPAPFDAPAPIVAAAARASDHRFADPDLGDVPADFLSSLDSTGGNSGSAVLDGQGRLVGLLFDGTYESIAADWIYLDAITRSICVDIRWVGFILEQLDGAERVIDELGLGQVSSPRGAGPKE